MADIIPIAPFGQLPVVCIASGPSLTLQQIRWIGIARAQNKCRVIAINDSIYPAYYADIGWACDRKWWIRAGGLQNFKGLKLSLEKTPFNDVITLKNTGIEGFDEDPASIRGGANSGYQVIQVAAKIGAKKIILVGYDYSGNGARDHFFGLHEGEFDKSSNVDNWRKYFKDLTEILKAKGVTIVNASISSTLKHLPMVDLRSELGI